MARRIVTLLLAVVVSGTLAVAAAPLPDAGAAIFPVARHVHADPTGEAGSGGLAVAHRAGGVLVEAPAEVPDARIFSTGAFPIEPSLGIGPDGTIYVVMAQKRKVATVTASNMLMAPAVLASADRGASWEVVQFTHPVTQDPYLHVDPATGRIFTMDFVGCMLLSFSDDGGSWTTIPGTGCGWNLDHQSVFTGPPVTSRTMGYPHVVYVCTIGGGPAAGGGTLVTCSKSLDGGLTWVPTGDPAFEHANDGLLPALFDPLIDGCSAGSGHGFAMADGTILVPRGHCGQPWLAISADEGATWRRVQVASNGMPSSPDLMEHEAAVVADASGNLYYFWVAADWRPYLAISRDMGHTWGAPIDIAPPGLVAAALPAMAVGDGDNLAFAYMGTPHQRGPAAWWHAYVAVTTNALAAEPVFLTTTANTAADPLVVGACGPVRCQSQYDFLDVQVAPDGGVWMVFADGCDLTSPIGCNGLAGGYVGTLVGGPSLRE